MEQKVQNWATVTKGLYSSVLLYQVAGVVEAIINPISNVGNTASNFQSLMNSGTIDAGIGFWDVIMFLLGLAVIAGYVLFLMGLGKWIPMLPEGDAKAVKQIRTGVILGIIGAVVALIPMLGWVGGILNIIAFIMMILGYNSLKNSTTFPAVAAKGAGKIFLAMILTLVGVILNFIPLVGGFIAMVLDIIAFFMVISGWKLIKESPQPAK